MKPAWACPQPGAKAVSISKAGVPVVAQQLVNPPSIHEDAGLIPGLAPQVGEWSIAVSCGVGGRCGSDPTLLWLWCRPATWDWTPSLGTSICRRCGPTKTKDKRDKINVYALVFIPVTFPYSESSLVDFSPDILQNNFYSFSHPWELDFVFGALHP